MFLRLTILELRKIAARPRSYIGFAAIAVIAGLIQFAMYSDGEDYIRFITQSVEQSFLFEGKILNGNLICFIILQMLIIQIPLLVALVSGDMISGEAAMGTLRFPGVPVQFDGQRPPTRTPPRLGADTEAVLRQAGIDEDQLQRCKAEGAAGLKPT